MSRLSRGTSQTFAARALALVIGIASSAGLWADFKAHALEQSALVRSGDDMKEWIEEIGGRP